MTDGELIALLGDLESDRVERKASAADASKIRQTVCAFANDLPDHGGPGVLFIGANDDGSCAGLPITDELLRKLSDIRSDGNTVPFPRIEVEKRTLNGCSVAVVLVYPSDAPPVRYQGRVYVRVGSRQSVATPHEERVLAERGRDLPFDLQTLPSVPLADLDLDLFERTYLPAAVSTEVLAENQRTVEQKLASLRLVRSGAPTVLGVLVLARDPSYWLPGAYVQFVWFDGIDPSSPLRGSAVKLPLPEALKEIESKLASHIEVASDLISGPIEIRRPDYPVRALREIVRNAVLHRTYEGTNAPVRVNWFLDRVEISSPGGPYGAVTQANFGQPDKTDYRNPHLAEAMRNLGYVQKFGAGIAIARAEMARNGNPPLEFQVDQERVLAILRRR